ncbi:hypothetical protein [Kiloniella majae]|uniref:hypothetical protein n=1 Tax=Kiloniella majae TaxID=1938558 RepID=UPI000A279627|nr:hypothetical protein [Kiloniella majae]
MKIKQHEDIKDIFSIFHDGVISASSLHDESIILDIEIQYLSERINPEYTGFKVSLYGFCDVEFSTWPSDLKSDPEKITDIKSIFKPELEILRANIKNNKIEVVCNQHSHEYDYCGGVLLFTLNSAEVQDASGKFYSIEDLDTLCTNYWNK